ncbi:MAG: DUF1361 domain-containing protein [Oscillospiraceae bacterium]|nr:DUF1361 domain-containing protein [Oscillospiraceae bacterium]
MKFLVLFLSVLLLNIFAVVTIILRPKLFRVRLYKPMLWNFKLSVLPLMALLLNIAVFAALNIAGAHTGVPAFYPAARTVFFIGLAVWLLLLPNAGYLITELNLNHRDRDEKEVPIWYDIVSVLSLALSGIVNTLANIAMIQLSFLVAFDPEMLTAGDYAALFASGFGLILLIVTGIYLGRAVRFNSWDVLHPGAFFKKCKTHFSGPGIFKEFLLFIIFHTVFFMIMYVSFGIPFYFVA